MLVNGRRESLLKLLDLLHNVWAKRMSKLRWNNKLCEYDGRLKELPTYIKDNFQLWLNVVLNMPSNDISDVAVLKFTQQEYR